MQDKRYTEINKGNIKVCRKYRISILILLKKIQGRVDRPEAGHKYFTQKYSAPSEAPMEFQEETVASVGL